MPGPPTSISRQGYSEDEFELLQEWVAASSATVTAYVGRRPYEVPGRAVPSWTLERSTAAGVRLYYQRTGALGEPTALAEALENVEAIVRSEMSETRAAVHAIAGVLQPKIPRSFVPT
jgi:hypothetical protein